MLHMWDFGTNTGWWMGFGMIWMVIFWGAIIALIVWAVKKFTARTDSHYHHNHHQDSVALDAAKERYARGEITKEQFEEIKRTIS